MAHRCALLVCMWFDTDPTVIVLHKGHLCLQQQAPGAWTSEPRDRNLAFAMFSSRWGTHSDRAHASLAQAIEQCLC